MGNRPWNCSPWGAKGPPFAMSTPTGLTPEPAPSQDPRGLRTDSQLLLRGLRIMVLPLRVEAT